MGKATVVVGEWQLAEVGAPPKGSSEDPSCLSLVVPSLSNGDDLKPGSS